MRKQGKEKKCTASPPLRLPGLSPDPLLPILSLLQKINKKIKTRAGEAQGKMQNQPGHSPPSAQAHTQLSGCRLRVGIFFFLLFFLSFIFPCSGCRGSAAESHRTSPCGCACAGVSARSATLRDFSDFLFLFQDPEIGPDAGLETAPCPPP